MADKRNILVCGGGFIGGHLAKDLQEQGHNVRVINKTTRAVVSTVEGTEQLVLDLELLKTAWRSEGMDMVYNLALTWVEWVSLKTTTHCVCSVFLLMFICS